MKENIERGQMMPQDRLHIYYCQDNCGPKDLYRKKCPFHYGVAIEHLEGVQHLEGANDNMIRRRRDLANREVITYIDNCAAVGGLREINLKREPEYDPA